MISKNEHRFLERVFPYIIIFLVSLIPFFFGTNAPDPAGMFNLRDSVSPIDPTLNMEEALYAWNSELGLGYQNFGGFLIPGFHLPLFVLQRLFRLTLLNAEKVYLTIIFFGLGCSVYYFLSHYLTFGKGKTEKLGSLLGTLFFMFSIPVNQRFIGTPYSILPVAIFPVFLVLVDRIFRSTEGYSLKYPLAIALLSPFFFSDPSFAYLFTPFLLIFLIFNLSLIASWKKAVELIKSGILTLTLIFLANAFWLLPIVNDFLWGKTILNDSVGAEHNLQAFFATASSVNSFLDVLRLHWTKDSFDAVSITGKNYYPAFIRFYYHLSVSKVLFIGFLVLGIIFSIFNKSKRREILIISSMGILGLLFCLGQEAPLAFWLFHRFLFLHFPGFTILRSFTKFQFLLLLWYIVLLKIIVFGLLEKCQKRVILQSIVVILSLFFIVQAGLPWFGTNLSGRLEFFVLPKYYEEAKKWLEGQKEQFRFLVFPQGKWEETYSWGPVFELVPLYRNYFERPSLYQEPIDATGVKDFINPVETFQVDSLGNYLNFFNIKYVLLRQDLRKVKVLEEETFLQSMKDYLNQKNYELTKEFGNLLFYQNRSVSPLPLFYVPQEVIYSSGSRGGFFNIIDNIDFQPGIAFVNDERAIKKDSLGEIWIEGKIVNNAEEYLKDEKGLVERIAVVYSRHEPLSFIYKLVLLKEKFEEWQVSYDKKKFFEKKLFFASKRVSEMEATIPFDDANFRQVLMRYQTKMEEAIHLAEKMEPKEKEIMFLEIRVNLLAHRQRLAKKLVEKGEEKTVVLANDILEGLNGKIPDFNFDEFEYSVGLPKDGRWQILPLVRNLDLSKLTLKVDNLYLDSRIDEGSEPVGVELGKGEHKVVLKLKDEQNLIEESWQRLNQETSFQTIRDWQTNTLYKVSFEYKGNGGYLELGILHDEKRIIDFNQGLSLEKLFTEDLLRTGGTEWKKFETFYKAGETFAPKASLYFLTRPGQGNQIQLRNVKVSKFELPVLFLRLNHQTPFLKTEKEIVPELTFKKVNPTKYLVRVKGASKPYLLVFSEAYHPGWQAYLIDSRQAVPQERHFQANSFANAWQLTPEDVGGREDYEIVVEFMPQRALYFGLIISLISFISITIFLYLFRK